jgi:hypothetical protein
MSTCGVTVLPSEHRLPCPGLPSWERLSGAMSGHWHRRGKRTFTGTAQDSLGGAQCSDEVDQQHRVFSRVYTGHLVS